MTDTLNSENEYEYVMSNDVPLGNTASAPFNDRNTNIGHQIAPPLPNQTSVQGTGAPYTAAYVPTTPPQVYFQQTSWDQPPSMGYRTIPSDPWEYKPNDYLILTVIVLFICGFLNYLSLFMFSLPALICSLMAYKRKYQEGNYASAKVFGYAALILNIICVIWTLLIVPTIITVPILATVYRLGQTR